MVLPESENLCIEVPSGEIVKGWGLSKFAREHNLDNTLLGKVVNGEVWQLTRLDKSDLKNVREGTKNFRIEHFSRGGWQEINVKSEIRGNKIVINVSPNSYSFTVNGSYLASSNLPRADKVAIVREVRRQFEEITKNMGEGTAMSVTASEGDSRTEMRQRGYGDFGFSDPDRRGQMFGKVKNGKMTPIDEDEYDEDVKYSFSKT